MEPEIVFPENWSAPRELTRSLPREVRLAGAGIFMIVLSLLFFAGSPVALFFLDRLAANQSAQQQALRDEGREVQGEVVRVWRRDDKEQERMVDYRFEVDGGIYRGHTAAPRKIWDTLAVGAPIAIRFVPSKPELNHPAAWQSRVTPVWVGPLASAITAALGALFIVALRRQRGLLSEGLPAPGIVTSTFQNKNGRVVRYRFRKRNGSILKGSGQARRRGVAVGDLITVVYHPDNPRRNAPYPFDMYRVGLE